MDVTMKVAERPAAALPLTRATASEWRFVLTIIAAVLVLTTLPVAFAYLTAPADRQYMGIMVNVPDHAQYFSWMREFTTSWLSANKLTPEPNRPIFFNLLWFGLARIGGLMGMPFEVSYRVMFELMRVCSITLFLLLVYRMCTWFFADVPRRRAAFLIATFTSGFGWVLIVMKYTVTRGEVLNPLDVFVAEGNTFYSALAFPHFIGAALYIWVFDLVLRGQAKRQLHYAVVAGLFAQFMGWQHAYDLVIVYAVLGTYALFLAVRDRRLPWFTIASIAIVGVLSCPPALYSFLLTKLDPVWGGVLAQFDNAGVFTPPPYRLPVLLGLPFLLAIFAVVADGVASLRVRRHIAAARPVVNEHVGNNDLFVKAWFLISFVLVYLPVDFQIHMLNGWQVPIAFLATTALFDYIAPAIERRWGRNEETISRHAIRRGLTVAILALIIPTNVYLLAWRFVDLRRYDYPYYLHHAELDALKWLERNVNSDDVVLSSLTTGQYVPMLTGAHAYLAHWAQTLDFFNKRDAVGRFFDAATSDAERDAILRAHGVDYVLVGPAERALGDFAPERSALLTEAYANSLVRVYRVNAP